MSEDGIVQDGIVSRKPGDCVSVLRGPGNLLQILASNTQLPSSFSLCRSGFSGKIKGMNKAEQSKW